MGAPTPTATATDAGLSAGVAATDDDASLAVAFERAARCWPDRVALAAADGSFTYAQLNATANRAAHAILARGGAPGDRVVILMRHDAPQIAAMIATLKAGRIVVALNPADPPARLRQRMIDAQAQLIVTDAATAAAAGAVAPAPGCILRFEHAAASGPNHDPQPTRAADDLAFLVYTSGSTAQPKAVMHLHRKTIENVRSLSRSLAIGPDDRVVLLGAISAGQGVSTAWSALLTGASLWPFPVMEHGVTGLAAFLVTNAITVYVSSATLYRRFIGTLDPDLRFAALRAVRVASEVATAEDFHAFERRCPNGRRFLHTYASSETGNVAHLCLTPGDTVPDGRLPVGRPVEGVAVRVVDEHGRDAAPGTIGEIVVVGRSLAAGYWRQPALTAERFSSEPVGDPRRSYRGGDLGRFNGEGLLELHGRKDASVKIRGHRIDVAEVESALAGQPGVASAAVCVVERAGGEPQLVAYVVARDAGKLSAGTLRRGLRALLPGHMVPSGFAFLDSIPLTPGGKVDRAALRQTIPPPRAPAAAGRDASATEALLGGLWSDALGIAGVGPEDDFFDLGGDSLAAAVVAVRLHAALGVELNLGAFVEHPRLDALAAAVDARLRDGVAPPSPPVTRAPRDRPLPMSYVQERTWTYMQASPDAARYASVRRFRLRGPLDAALLRECIAAIVDRHEILRTRFATIDGEAVQVVEPPGRFAVDFHDVSDRPAPEAAATELAESEAARPVALDRAPPLRFTLIRLDDRHHILVRAHHHMLGDGRSLDIFLRELAQSYDARLRGEPSPLAAVAPLHHGDYAVWQRAQFVPGQPAYERSLAHWAARLTPDLPALELPFFRSEAADGLAPRTGRLVCGTPTDRIRQLDALARSRGATPFVVRLAAFVALLADESGRPDLAIGSYFSSRNRLETHDMIGDFANLATLRFRLAPQRAFADWLTDVRDVVTDAEGHCAMPYEMLCTALRARGVRPPEISAIFVASQRRRPPQFGGLDVAPIESEPLHMPWGFSMIFSADEANSAGRCTAKFNAAIYDPAKVGAFVARMDRLLDLAGGDPARTVAALLDATTVTAPVARPSSRLSRFLPRRWRPRARG